VHRLDHGLMVVLDVDKVLDLSKFGVAAQSPSRVTASGGRNA
jgi:hypothetical protein